MNETSSVLPAAAAVCCNAAIACERRSIEAWSATAAPSMSKSMCVKSVGGDDLLIGRRQSGHAGDDLGQLRAVLAAERDTHVAAELAHLADLGADRLVEGCRR